MAVYGHCDARFIKVREAFEENLANRDEIGACVCLVVEGRKVVDLWGGHTDAAKNNPWQEDTIVNVWSVGKAVAALCLLTQLEQSALGVDDRVADIWPEFAAEDKDKITFEALLAHRAGLCGVLKPMAADAFYHWDQMTSALADQKPWWEPDTNHGYHTNTFGFLMGEPIRRLSGISIRDYFQRNIADKLNVDFHFGVPEEDLNRCADIAYIPRPPAPETDKTKALDKAPDPDDPMNRMRYFIYNNPPLSASDFNSSAWRRSVFPSTSPHSNARSTATIFSELAEILYGKYDSIAGNPFISRSTLAAATATVSDGEDLNLQRPTRFGHGFQLTQPDRPLGPNDGTFGHYGNGGHLVFADPTVPLGFAYHMNHHGFAWRDPRNIALTDAVYDSLGSKK